MKLLLSFLLIASLSLVHADQCNRNQNFEIYLLSLTWSPAFCAKNFCKKEVKDDAKFVIHGLWPNNVKVPPGQKYPENVGFCCLKGNEDKNFNQIVNSLEDKNKLATVWPSMRDNRPESFWFHEYKKHGSCSSGQAEGVKNYFEKTLEIFEKLNLDNVMKNANFVPSDNLSKTYNSRELANALTKAVGAKPKIRCLRTNKAFAVLEQISFCFDKSLKPVDCEGNLQCARDVIIPNHRADLSKLNL